MPLGKQRRARVCVGECLMAATLTLLTPSLARGAGTQSRAAPATRVSEPPRGCGGDCQAGQATRGPLPPALLTTGCLSPD